MALKRTITRPERYRRQTTLESLESRRVLANLAGTVYEDVNANRTLDDGEPPLSGVVVYLDANGNGRLDQEGVILEPDRYRDGEVLNSSQQVILPAGTGVDNQPAFRVRAVDAVAYATTGQRVFANEQSLSWGPERRLRFDFSEPVGSLSLDAIGTSATARADVVLEAYANDGQLLGRHRVRDLSNGESGRLQLVREEADIDYALAYVDSDRGSVTFDNLRTNDVTDERSTLTSDSGFYRFPDLPEGQYLVSQQVPAGYQQSSPFPELSYDVDVNGSVSRLDFGNRTASISGIAFQDAGVVGIYEPLRDDVMAGRALYLDTNDNGSPDPLSFSLDPDTFLRGEVLDFVARHVTLSTVDSDHQPLQRAVVAAPDAIVNQDGLLFTHEGEAAWSLDNRLRMDFKAPASVVSLDFIAAADEQSESGTLIAYSATGRVLAAVTTPPLLHGELATMQIEREGFDIAYAVAYTSDSRMPSGRLDNLRATLVSEPTVITDSEGNYTFKPLAAGDHRVRPLPATDQDVTFPEFGFYQRELRVGDAEEELNFGFVIGNTPPTAKGDRVTTTEDSEIFIDVLANDSDPDGELFLDSVRITRPPLHGSAEVNLDGTIVYRPAANFHGTDTLLYTVRDNQRGESNSAAATILVEAVNDAPQARHDAVSILGAGDTIIGVLANDSDVDSPLVPSTVTVVANPTHGTARVDPLTGNVVYTSPAGSSDTFSYTVDDQDGLTSITATVTVVAIAEGVPPVAREDTFSVREGTRTFLPVLQNDTDDDGRVDPGGLVIVTLPNHGTTRLAEDGTIEYRPTLGFIGDDTLEYLVRDDAGLASNLATATITISERDFPYQNPMNRLDTNSDGFIVPRDALLIINEINAREMSDPISGEFHSNPLPGERPAAYFDVSGDGFVVARDVLLVINFLNEQAAAAVSLGSAAAVAVARPALDAAAVAALFASDDDNEDNDDEVMA